ncbi:MAG TPA: hypothetical protein VI789_07530 [Dehalococcoidia bacterium]|nr:hypothetical protein [Dehalococcoidia bacterium]
MPLSFTHRKAHEVPPPAGGGRVNRDLESIINELTRLATGMVLEIETGDEKAIRATKALITRAGQQLGTPMRHWHAGTKVFAQPTNRRMRKQRSERANLGDHRES